MSRSPEYQIRLTEENIKSWFKKVEHSIRALKDDDKHNEEWTYLHLVNLQDDMEYLNKFIDQLLVIRIMRDSNELSRPDDAPVSQSVEETGSNPV